MAEFTEILQAIEQGDRLAADQLLPLVYDELRRLAASRLSRESPGQTLQPTALVHEAYLRLLGGESVPEWESKRHFFAAAAEAMRRILVERARRKETVKHGGNLRRLNIDDELIADDQKSTQILALDEALSELERHDSRAAQVANLRYFAGLTLQETADAMQISPRTADRLWALAKAWLCQYLTSE